jgi:hypothetical protein
MKKKNWVYDLEIYPNFFSATFIDLMSDEERVFYIFEDVNQLAEMIDFIQHESAWILGYNSSKYDDIILRYLMHDFEIVWMTAEEITDRLFILSKEIIGCQRNGGSIWRNQALKPYLKDSYFNSMDLMSMMYFDKKRIGLKKVAVAMKWPKIQDLPKPFDELVLAHEVKNILKYNRNDVLITKQLALEQRDEIQIRIDVGALYGLNLMSSSRSGMADKLMSKFWEKETGLSYFDFKNGRTVYDEICLADCISSKVRFRTPILQNLLTKMYNTIWRGKSIENHVIINQTKYDVLLGGLHSVRKPEIFESTEEYDLIDLDVASYYPNLILTLGIFPRHLSERFLTLYRKLVDQRMAAKNSGEKLTAEALKIVVNAVYGKLNFEFGWLFDTMASYTVTLTGQLFLLMLVEALELNGIEVFYANTDGLTCKVYKNKKAKFDEICTAWQKYTELELEFNKYQKCVIRDVNNYLIIKDDGKTKTKGCFTEEIDMTKGYNNPIVPHAIAQYYTHGIPVRQTIESHTDIYDFCKSQNVGSQYKQEFHTLNEDKTDLLVVKCQKTNRYYVSKGVGKLYKVKENGETEDLVAGHNVTLFNDAFKHDDFKDYKIDYNYYVAQANKIITVMESKQLSLF